MYMTSQTPYQAQVPEAVRRMRRLVLLVSAVFYGLYSLILAPVYTQLSANVVYQDALLTVILSYVVSAVDVIVFFVVYPATVYAIWRGGFVGSCSVPGTFALATLGKYVLNFFMTCLTDGGFPSFELFVEQDLPIMLPSFLLEMLQYGLIVLFAVGIRHARMRKYQEDMLTAKKPYSERALAFPMTSLFSYRNAVQWMAFWSAVVVLMGRLFMHGIYQLTLLVYNGETDPALVMIIDVVADLLISAVAYFLSVLLTSYFDRKDMERLAAGKN